MIQHIVIAGAEKSMIALAKRIVARMPPLEARRKREL